MAPNGEDMHMRLGDGYGRAGRVRTCVAAMLSAGPDRAWMDRKRHGGAHGLSGFLRVPGVFSVARKLASISSELVLLIVLFSFSWRYLSMQAGGCVFSALHKRVQNVNVAFPDQRSKPQNCEDAALETCFVERLRRFSEQSLKC